MMKKRGQGGEAFKYFIIAIMIVFITFFGYSVVQKVMKNTCNADLARFEISLKGLDKAVKYGSVREFTEQVPCDADEIYFFDLGKDINLDFLSHLPLLKDSVASKAEKNVFLVKDSKIMHSFYAGSLDIDFPDYICFLPKFDKINFFAEGKGKEAAVFPGCLQPECTFIPESITNQEAADIIREGKAFGDNFFCENCPREIQDEWAKFVQARENVEIFRKYEYCKETGKTNVEITIRPKGDVEVRNFRYYESIPKSCIDDLRTYLSRVEGDVSIKNDPLMIWMLSDIKAEEKISYELDKLLTDECKEVIKGLGVAEAIENGITAAVPDLPAAGIVPQGQNTPPSISDIQGMKINLRFQDQEQQVIEDLFQEASDRDIISEQLIYSITRQTNTNAVECYIKDNYIKETKEVWCTTRQNTFASSDITLEVSDGQDVSQATFTVSVEPGITCGDGKPEGTEECDDGNRADLDGCSQSCRIETGWTCNDEPSECTFIQPNIKCKDFICDTVAGENCQNCHEDCGRCLVIPKFAVLACWQTDQKCSLVGVDPCSGYDTSNKIGWCLFPLIRNHLCVNEWNSGCTEDPLCPAGYIGHRINDCCLPKYSATCSNNDVYWLDSCNNREDKKEDCGTTTTTSDLRCNGNILERKKINRGCSAGQCTQTQEWITEQNCGAAGKECDANSRSCVSPPPPPQPEEEEKQQEFGEGGGGGNGGASCFPAGTKITLGNGTTKNIEDVKVGDVVLAYDPKTQTNKPTKVFELESPIREGYYKLNGNLLRVTNEHPIYVKKHDGREGWASINPLLTIQDSKLRPIMQLEKRDMIKTLDDDWVELKTIEYVQGKLRTYNLKSVEEYQTFYADGVLVHNK